MGGRTGSGPAKGGPGGLGGDFDKKRGGYSGEIKNVRSLSTMKDPRMYKATGEAISRFYSVFGINDRSERNVKIADLSPRVYGVAQTTAGIKSGVYLNRTYFSGANAKKEMTGRFKKEYDSNWQTRTNKPIAHVVTHELGHSLWTSAMKSPQAIAAAKSVRKLYSSWVKDKNKTGYGKYSRTNIDEFWAETCTKAVHGTADRYTRAVKGIVKKYKL